ncbi:MAG: hypothetical protein ONB17_12230 [candidate division KSB1 bacterium]|nr:hypothetical protein [candidate division KSB1 bacterium]
MYWDRRAGEVCGVIFGDQDFEGSRIYPGVMDAAENKFATMEVAG